MVMPGKKFNLGAGYYRYGFNGKELDSESPVQYDYGSRIYDPRLGRFKSVDPLTQTYPWYTPYQFAGNNPIWAVDLDGLEEYIVVTSLYADGGKKVSIEYVTKKGTKNVVDLQYQQIMKKDAQGNTLELGKRLTNNKVARITVGVDGRETTSYGDKLSGEEIKIKETSTRKAARGPANDKIWTINVGNKDYDSPVERDLTKYSEFGAEKNYSPLKPKISITDFSYYSYTGDGTNPAGVGENGLPVKGGDLTNETINTVESIAEQIKGNGGVKSISITVPAVINTDIRGNELRDNAMKGAQAAADNVKNILLKSGVKNINASAVQTNFSPTYDKNGAVTNMPNASATIIIKR
jgi:RHS repeat-associated protein